MKIGQTGHTSPDEEDICHYRAYWIPVSRKFCLSINAWDSEAQITLEFSCLAHFCSPQVRPHPQRIFSTILSTFCLKVCSSYTGLSDTRLSNSFKVYVDVKERFPRFDRQKPLAVSIRNLMSFQASYQELFTPIFPNFVSGEGKPFTKWYLSTIEQIVTQFVLENHLSAYSQMFNPLNDIKRTPTNQLSANPQWKMTRKRRTPRRGAVFFWSISRPKVRWLCCP